MNSKYIFIFVIFLVIGAGFVLFINSDTEFEGTSVPYTTTTSVPETTTTSVPETTTTSVHKISPLDDLKFYYAFVENNIMF